MSAVFTDEDVRRLDKTMLLRERIVDNFNKLPDDQLPRKPSDLMAVVNLAESVDRSIIQRARLVVDADQAEDDKLTKNVLRGLMQDLHTNKRPGPLPGEAPREAPVYKGNENFDIRPGELISKSDNISLEES